MFVLCVILHMLRCGIYRMLWLCVLWHLWMIYRCIYGLNYSLFREHCISRKTSRLQTKTLRMKEHRIIHPLSEISQNSKYILFPALLVRWSDDSRLQSNAPSQDLECTWFLTLIATSQLNSLQIEHSQNIM